LFGILAGVRCNYFKQIKEQRGMPKDFEMVRNKYGCFYHPTKLEYDTYGEDSPGYYMGEHSYSWLLVSELRKYNWRKYLESSNISRDLDDVMKFCEPGDKYRIVFGFDS